MKKTVAFLLIILIATLLTVVSAEDLGVQIIGGPNTNGNESLSLDDMVIGEDYKIDGYAIITPIGFEFVDYFAQFTKDSTRATNRLSNVLFIGGTPDLVWVIIEGPRKYLISTNF